MEQRQAIWRNAGANTELINFDFFKENDRFLIQTKLYLVDVKSYLTIEYSFLGNGEMELELHFEPGIKGVQNMPRFGMSFVLTNAFQLEY